MCLFSIILTSARRHHVVENPSQAKVQDPDSHSETKTFISLGTAFLKRVEDNERWQRELIQAIKSTYTAGQTNLALANRAARVTEEHIEAEVGFFSDQIISRLCFSSFDDRMQRIPQAFRATYEWLFTDSGVDGAMWSSFPDWLEKQEGVYWIKVGLTV
jgi:hypothetical protein